MPVWVPRTRRNFFLTRDESSESELGPEFVAETCLSLSLPSPLHYSNKKKTNKSARRGQGLQAEAPHPLTFRHVASSLALTPVWDARQPQIKHPIFTFFLKLNLRDIFLWLTIFLTPKIK